MKLWEQLDKDLMAIGKFENEGEYMDLLAAKSNPHETVLLSGRCDWRICVPGEFATGLYDRTID